MLLRSRMAAIAAASAASAALAVGAVGFTAAQASSAAVLSNITFAGTAAPGTTPGNIVISSSSCSLKASGHSYNCRLKSNATIGMSGIGGKFSMNTLPVRAYGDINGTYTLTPTATPNSYSMSGSGEQNSYKNGQPSTSFKVSFTGTWTVAPSMSGFTVSGSMTVTRP